MTDFVWWAVEISGEWVRSIGYYKTEEEALAARALMTDPKHDFTLTPVELGSENARDLWLQAKIAEKP